MFVAFLAGHFVQNSDQFLGVKNTRVLTTAVDADTVVAPRSDPSSAISFDVQDIRQLSAPTTQGAGRQSGTVALPAAPEVTLHMPGIGTEIPALATRLSRLDQGRSRPEPARQRLNQYGLPCDTELTATPAAGAMVHLSLSASCQPNTRVDIVQDRLRFAVRTSHTGTLTLDVPALSVAPVFMFEFADGTVLTTAASVPDARGYARMALQWQGDNAMQLHALEFGADYDDKGHVWNGNPRDPAYGDTARGGFLTRLGDPALPGARLAEIYSYPSAESREEGVVRISVEAEVTQANCEREIIAEVLQPGADGKMQSAEVSMAVPDCDALGEFLVLKNILQDLKIAHN
ncbi:hypothetical protein [Actibacterium sp. D379-3]